MARRFKRRKPRVAWFPTFGGARIAEDDASPFPGIEVDLFLDPATPPERGVIWDAFALTFDQTESSEQAQSDPTKITLRDIVQGNEWKLRRLVGKAFIGCSGIAADGSGQIQTNLQVGLGFIVCKTYDDGAPITDFNEVNPLAQESMEDPWIWRRTWMLSPTPSEVLTTWSNFSSTDTYLKPNLWGFPCSNVSYGSVADGPHIDSKVQRRIHRSERLYGVLAARRYYGDLDLSETSGFRSAAVHMMLDYRILGSLAGQTYGNRGNTSR